MNFFRNHILFRILCLALAVHIFNISADMPDALPDYVPEDLTVNDQESVVELVLEKCMGLDNAVEEHDEPDDVQSFELLKELQLYSCSYQHVSFVQHPIALHITPPSFEVLHLYPYTGDIIPPPPKA